MIHEFTPKTNDGLDKVGEVDILNKEVVVLSVTPNIPSTFNEGDTYTELVFETSAGKKVIWQTGAMAIPDQAAGQELPFRAAIVKRSGRNGRDYLSFAPPSEAEGPL